MPSLRFGLRGLLSLMTGLAFVGYIANWLLAHRGSNDPAWLVLLLVVPCDLKVLWFVLAFAACGSGLLAAFVGIPREGIRLSNKQCN